MPTALSFNGPVTFGGVSIGDATARVGIVIDKKLINLKSADQLFCERRLTGKITLGVHDEDATQGKLIDDADHEVAGTFDVKGFRCSADYIGIGATFSLKEIDIAELAKFSKGAGRLVVESADVIPEEPRPEPPIKTSGQPATLKAKGPWRKVKIETLFDPEKTICKALLNAGIETTGQLADYTEANKGLDKIDGLGPKKIEEIDRVMDQFWFDNDIDDDKMAATGAASAAE